MPQSENVIFSKKRGVHVCEDCGHEFTPEKPFVPPGKGKRGL